MATSTQEWIDELKSISVLELADRIKALEEEFGVSAAAVQRPSPPAAAQVAMALLSRLKNRAPSTSSSPRRATRRSR